MHIVSVALGGCLKGEPVRYGVTEDTGGHITYILGEMEALARRDDVEVAEIVTRRFDDPRLGTAHAQPEEWLGAKLVIRRIDSGDRRYLAKEALSADRDAFAEALIAELAQRERLPDLIHAHFADAADVARRDRGQPGPDHRNRQPPVQRAARSRPDRDRGAIRPAGDRPARPVALRGTTAGCGIISRN